MMLSAMPWTWLGRALAGVAEPRAELGDVEVRARVKPRLEVACTEDEVRVRNVAGDGTGPLGLEVRGEQGEQLDHTWCDGGRVG